MFSFKAFGHEVETDTWPEHRFGSDVEVVGGYKTRRIWFFKLHIIVCKAV